MANTYREILGLGDAKPSEFMTGDEMLNFAEFTHRYMMNKARPREEDIERQLERKNWHQNYQRHIRDTVGSPDALNFNVMRQILSGEADRQLEQDGYDSEWVYNTLDRYIGDHDPREVIRFMDEGDEDDEEYVNFTEHFYANEGMAKRLQRRRKGPITTTTARGARTSAPSQAQLRDQEAQREAIAATAPDHPAAQRILGMNQRTLNETPLGVGGTAFAHAGDILRSGAEATQMGGRMLGVQPMDPQMMGEAPPNLIGPGGLSEQTRTAQGAGNVMSGMGVMEMAQGLNPLDPRGGVIHGLQEAVRGQFMHTLPFLNYMQDRVDPRMGVTGTLVRDLTTGFVGAALPYGLVGRTVSASGQLLGQGARAAAKASPIIERGAQAATKITRPVAKKASELHKRAMSWADPATSTKSALNPKFRIGQEARALGTELVKETTKKGERLVRKGVPRLQRGGVGRSKAGVGLRAGVHAGVPFHGMRVAGDVATGEGEFFESLLHHGLQRPSTDWLPDWLPGGKYSADTELRRYLDANPEDPATTILRFFDAFNVFSGEGGLAMDIAFPVTFNRMMGAGKGTYDWAFKDKVGKESRSEKRGRTRRERMEQFLDKEGVERPRMEEGEQAEDTQPRGKKPYPRDMRITGKNKAGWHVGSGWVRTVGERAARDVMAEESRLETATQKDFGKKESRLPSELRSARRGVEDAWRGSRTGEAERVKPGEPGVRRMPVEPEMTAAAFQALYENRLAPSEREGASSLADPTHRAALIEAGRMEGATDQQILAGRAAEVYEQAMAGRTDATLEAIHSGKLPNPTQMAAETIYLLGKWMRENPRSEKGKIAATYALMMHGADMRLSQHWEEWMKKGRTMEVKATTPEGAEEIGDFGDLPAIDQLRHTLGKAKTASEKSILELLEQYERTPSGELKDKIYAQLNNLKKADKIADLRAKLDAYFKPETTETTEAPPQQAQEAQGSKGVDIREGGSEDALSAAQGFGTPPPSTPAAPPQEGAAPEAAPFEVSASAQRAAGLPADPGTKGQRRPARAEDLSPRERMERRKRVAEEARRFAAVRDDMQTGERAKTLEETNAYIEALESSGDLEGLNALLTELRNEAQMIERAPQVDTGVRGTEDVLEGQEGRPGAENIETVLGEKNIATTDVLSTVSEGYTAESTPYPREGTAYGDRQVAREEYTYTPQGQGVFTQTRTARAPAHQAGSGGRTNPARLAQIREQSRKVSEHVLNRALVELFGDVTDSIPVNAIPDLARAVMRDGRGNEHRTPRVREAAQELQNRLLDLYTRQIDSARARIEGRPEPQGDMTTYSGTMPSGPRAGTKGAFRSRDSDAILHDIKAKKNLVEEALARISWDPQASPTVRVYPEQTLRVQKDKTRERGAGTDWTRLLPSMPGGEIVLKSGERIPVPEDAASFDIERVYQPEHGTDGGFKIGDRLIDVTEVSHVENTRANLRFASKKGVDVADGAQLAPEHLEGILRKIYAKVTSNVEAGRPRRQGNLPAELAQALTDVLHTLPTRTLAALSAYMRPDSADVWYKWGDPVWGKDGKFKGSVDNLQGIIYHIMKQRAWGEEHGGKAFRDVIGQRTVKGEEAIPKVQRGVDDRAEDKLTKRAADGSLMGTPRYLAAKPKKFTTDVKRVEPERLFNIMVNNIVRLWQRALRSKVPADRGEAVIEGYDAGQLELQRTVNELARLNAEDRASMNMGSELAGKVYEKLTRAMTDLQQGISVEGVVEARGLSEGVVKILEKFMHAKGGTDRFMDALSYMNRLVEALDAHQRGEDWYELDVLKGYKPEELHTPGTGTGESRKGVSSVRARDEMSAEELSEFDPDAISEQQAAGEGEILGEARLEETGKTYTGRASYESGRRTLEFVLEAAEKMPEVVERVGDVIIERLREYARNVEKLAKREQQEREYSAVDPQNAHVIEKFTRDTFELEEQRADLEKRFSKMGKREKMKVTDPQVLQLINLLLEFEAQPWTEEAGRAMNTLGTNLRSRMERATGLVSANLKQRYRKIYDTPQGPREGRHYPRIARSKIFGEEKELTPEEQRAHFARLDAKEGGAADASSIPEGMGVGAVIEHAKFGRGKITATRASLGGDIIVVKFDDGSTRQIKPWSERPMAEAGFKTWTKEGEARYGESLRHGAPRRTISAPIKVLEPVYADRATGAPTTWQVTQRLDNSVAAIMRTNERKIDDLKKRISEASEGVNKGKLKKNVQRLIERRKNLETARVHLRKYLDGLRRARAEKATYTEGVGWNVRSGVVKAQPTASVKYQPSSVARFHSKEALEKAALADQKATKELEALDAHLEEAFKALSSYGKDLSILSEISEGARAYLEHYYAPTPKTKARQDTIIKETAPAEPTLPDLPAPKTKPAAGKLRVDTDRLEIVRALNDNLPIHNAETSSLTEGTKQQGVEVHVQQGEGNRAAVLMSVRDFVDALDQPGFLDVLIMARVASNPQGARTRASLRREMLQLHRKKGKAIPDEKLKPQTELEQAWDEFVQNVNFTEAANLYRQKLNTRGAAAARILEKYKHLEVAEGE